MVASGADALGVPDEATLVLAVSGGPDSMSLLHGAASLLARGERAWRLVVAHLDHRLRPESSDDAAFVRSAAAELGLPCEVGVADVRSLAAADGTSLEETARDARYRFLEGVAPPDVMIATAHTLDDRVETMLMNLMRGSGLTGVRGMPARRGRIVRPLLAVRREDLRAALDAGGLSYRLDPSNDDPSFLRNRVRAELLPLLESLRAGSIERLARFSDLAADDDRLLDEVAAIELDRRRGTDRSIDWRHPPDPALGRRIMRLAIGDPAPSAERLGALLAAAGGGRGGVEVQLGRGRVATVRNRSIRIGH